MNKVRINFFFHFSKKKFVEFFQKNAKYYIFNDPTPSHILGMYFFDILDPKNIHFDTKIISVAHLVAKL